jgi:hypothetical protein
MAWIKDKVAMTLIWNLVPGGRKSPGIVPNENATGNTHHLWTNQTQKQN